MPEASTPVDRLLAGRAQAVAEPEGASDPGDRVPPDLPHSARGAILRGARGRCPRCGKARLFRKFLKPHDRCPNCGQDWKAQRADDFPSHVAIVLTGAVMAPIVAIVVQTAPMSLAGMMAVLLLLTLAVTLAWLQPVKGAIIAFQWWFEMHGFRRNEPGSEDLPS